MTRDTMTILWRNRDDLTHRRRRWRQQKSISISGKWISVFKEFQMDFVEWGFLCTNSALFKSDLTKSLISMIRLLTHVSSLGMMCYMRETSSALENVTCKCRSFCSGLNALGWRHQMETFSTLLSLCAGNQPATDGFPHKETVTRTSDVSLLSVQTNYWTNTRLPGNWRRHDGHLMSP